MSPSGDDWFETEVAPALIVNEEGNFNSIAASANIGTVWNAWETQWSGFQPTVTGGDFGEEVTRATRQVRTGVRTEVVEKVDLESRGTKVISTALIPFVRAKDITFDGFDFLPNTQVYPFFDAQAVGSFTRPSVGFSTMTQAWLMVMRL